MTVEYLRVLKNGCLSQRGGMTQSEGGKRGSPVLGLPSLAKKGSSLFSNHIVDTTEMVNA